MFVWRASVAHLTHVSRGEGTFSVDLRLSPVVIGKIISRGKILKNTDN